jgi:hypothetical protein
VTRIRRDAEPAIFWFEAGASIGLAAVLVVIGILAVAGRVATRD